MDKKTEEYSHNEYYTVMRMSKLQLHVTVSMKCPNRKLKEARHEIVYMIPFV